MRVTDKSGITGIAVNRHQWTHRNRETASRDAHLISTAKAARDWSPAHRSDQWSIEVGLNRKWPGGSAFSDWSRLNPTVICLRSRFCLRIDRFFCGWYRRWLGSVLFKFKGTERERERVPRYYPHSNSLTFINHNISTSIMLSDYWHGTTYANY